MRKTVFDPENTRWMRRAHGILPSRKGGILSFSPNTPFRLTGFEVDKGLGLIITNISIGPQRQLIPKVVIPLHTFAGIFCESCPVGSYVEVRFFNRTSQPIEYDFRVVGLELE